MNALPVVAAPGDFALGGDIDYLEYLCTMRFAPKVVMVTEAKNWFLDRSLHQLNLAKEWRGLQRTSSPATMGCAMAVHRSVEVLDWGQALGVAPVIAGKRVKMLTRYQTWAHLRSGVDSYFAVDVHTAPPRFAVLQPDYLGHVSALIAGHPHAFVGGDFNEALTQVALKLGLNVAGGQERGVGILSRPNLNAETHGLDRWGITHKFTDHPATKVILSVAAVPHA